MAKQQCQNYMYAPEKVIFVRPTCIKSNLFLDLQGDDLEVKVKLLEGKLHQEPKCSKLFSMLSILAILKHVKGIGGLLVYSNRK